MPLYTPGRRRAIILLLLTSALLLTLDLRGNALFDAARSGFTTISSRSRPPPTSSPGPSATPGAASPTTRTCSRRTSACATRSTPSAATRSPPRQRSRTCRSCSALNDLPFLGDYPRSTATVVGVSPSNLDQVIEINKGSDDGIDVGMAVVAGAGLVGKVTAPVLPNRANVMLIRDTRYATAVKIVPGAPPETTTTTAAPTSSADPPRRRPPSRAGDDRPDSTTPPARVDHHDELDHDDDRRRPTTATPASCAAAAPDQLPQVDLLDDSPVFGRIVEGDIVLTAGGTESLAPPDIPVGIVRNVVSRSSAEGPLLEIETLANLDRLHFVRSCCTSPSPRSRRRSTPRQVADAGIARAGAAAAAVLRRPRRARLPATLFADLRPAGVSIQVMLALAAAAGAAGGPQKGALAGFVLGLMYDLVGRHAARLVVAGHGPRRLRRRLRAVDHDRARTGGWPPCSPGSARPWGRRWSRSSARSWARSRSSSRDSVSSSRSSRWAPWCSARCSSRSGGGACASSARSGKLRREDMNRSQCECPARMRPARPECRGTQ